MRNIIVSILLLGASPAIAAPLLQPPKNMAAAPAPASVVAVSKPIASPTVNPAKNETVARVENYLNALTTILADFMQVAPDGSIAGGKFYLKRPGKMRWQYDPPTPILMVTNGSFLTYYDYELQQVSHIPLESTLAAFLARPTISFSDKAVTLEKVEKKTGIIRISLHQTDKPKDGTLLLEFADNPLQIRNMVVTDAQNHTTQVSLQNARFGVPLADDLFLFKDPRRGKRNK